METMTVSRIISPSITKKVMAFRDWKLQQLMKTFQLVRKNDCAILQEWLQMPYSLSKKEKAFLESLRQKLEIYSFHWNEIELEWNFISKLLDMVDYHTEQYHFFLGRQLEAQFKDILLKGRVDGVIASGMFEPERPFFCFHEYKKEKGADNDPIAQLLSAMLAVQRINNNQKPIYGCLILGRNWFFSFAK